MRRSISLFGIIIWLAVTAIGCSPAGTAQAKATPPLVDLKKDFELHLYTDKVTYSSKDRITIWATLKYIGEKPQIEIWHSDPYISFSIKDGNWFETGDVFDLVLSNTILDQGKLYRFDYQKCGGYDAEKDSHRAFWKEFYEEKELYLPPGKYHIRVRGAFSLDRTDPYMANNNNLVDETDITVQ